MLSGQVTDHSAYELKFVIGACRILVVLDFRNLDIIVTLSTAGIAFMWKEYQAVKVEPQQLQSSSMRKNIVEEALYYS